MKQTITYCDLCGEEIASKHYEMDLRDPNSQSYIMTAFDESDCRWIYYTQDDDGLSLHINHICVNCSKAIKEFLSNKLIFKESTYGTQSN